MDSQEVETRTLTDQAAERDPMGKRLDLIKKKPSERGLAPASKTFLFNLEIRK